jgi:hypothetical protein
MVRADERMRAAVELLVAADVSTCGHRELDALAGALQCVRGFVSSTDVMVARRRAELRAAVTTEEPLPEAEPAATIGGLPLDVSEFAGGRDRRPGGASGRDSARAEACSLLPLFERALRVGSIDAAHVDAVAVVLSDLDDVERAELSTHAEMLLEHALCESPERFRRRVRDLARRIAHDRGERMAERLRRRQQVRRWIDRRTGMGHLHAELDPESTARVWAALDEHLGVVRGRNDTAGVSLQRLEVDALVELVSASPLLHHRSPELSVLIDWNTLRSGVLAAGGVCETFDGVPLTPAAVRRLACEAWLLPVVLGGDGLPLDVGRRRRLATREQRVALAAMYAGCSMPSCGVRFEQCRIHHLDPWQPSGLTDLDNLIPLCSRHHHDVHDGGWTLTMTSDRVITLRDPAGTLVFEGDTRDRTGAPELPGEFDEVMDRTGSHGPGGAATGGTDSSAESTEVSVPMVVRAARHRVEALTRRRRCHDAAVGAARAP